MTEAKTGDTVRVHYTGKLDDGTVFDSSSGREPLEFTLGVGAVISGFDDAVSGMEVGGETTVTVPSDDAYGPRRDELVHAIDRAAVPDEIDLRPGLELQAQTPGGDVVRMVVVDVTEGEVTLDANHPLAGEDLTFDIKLVEIV